MSFMLGMVRSSLAICSSVGADSALRSALLKSK